MEYSNEHSRSGYRLEGIQCPDPSIRTNDGPDGMRYKALKASIVDAAIQYDSPYDGKSYILIVRGAIHVLSMTNNLVPPFVLSGA